VTSSEFREALRLAQETSGAVADATTPADDLGGTGACFLTDDLQSGFRIGWNGELTGVFSLVKGRGDVLVSESVSLGATHLDCFDGYLPTLYGRHGFMEARRERNWVEGDPDVVYMVLAD